MGFKISNGSFYKNGEKINLYSGAMHYFRILSEYWEDRLTKLKMAGFNTVETYVPWNLHEPKKGEYNFSGMLDIAEYIRIAGKVGLNAIVRPGPYICAEWDFGGLPAWLLKDKNLRIRCHDKTFLEHVSSYYQRLLKEVVPLQITNGGNVIAMQVENEYGSYGNDKKYLEAVKQIMLDNGVDVLLFTSDGLEHSMLSGGTLDGVYKTLNFGSGAGRSFKHLDRFNENHPKMCMEFWCGWFDHWGFIHHTRNYKSIIRELEAFFEQDASFNFYMFHGGTNFGFTAGANHHLNYRPTVTSYDYSAVLNEYGDYTPTYHAVREFMHKKQGLPLGELPPAPKKQYIGHVSLAQSTSLFDNLDNIGEKHYSPMPESMEYYGQNFGMIYYKTIVKGKYGLSALSLKDMHDRAYVYIDGKHKATLDRSKRGLLKRILKKDAIIVPAFDKECEISVLVDAMGRVNYGEHICDRKGISAVNLNMQTMMDFEVTTLPLDNIDKLDYSKNSGKYPLFFKGTFETSSNAECFVKLDNFTKGVVYINNFNLGRYWKVGPQQTLYLPGSLLHTDKPNEIVVLELENCKDPTIEIIDRHLLSKRQK